MSTTGNYDLPDNCGSFRADNYGPVITMCRGPVYMSSTSTIVEAAKAKEKKL